MEKEKEQQLQTLLDGITENLKDLEKVESNIRWKVRAIEKLLSPEVKDEF